MEKVDIRGGGGDHEQVQLLLPWYQLGRLEASEHAFVAAHLADCARCRAELRAEQAPHAEVSRAQLDLERDWSRLAARIRSGRPSAPSPRSRPRRWAALAGGLVAAQAALVLILGFELVSRPGPAEYRALASPPAPAARFLVTFRPDSAEADLRGALRAAGARVVDGPTDTDAYVLEAPAARRAEALAALRARPQVLAAESLGPEAR